MAALLAAGSSSIFNALTAPSTIVILLFVLVLVGLNILEKGRWD